LKLAEQLVKLGGPAVPVDLYPDSTVEAVALWRRLDTLGTDAARLTRHTGGWTLFGTAVFLPDKQPARLDYEVELHIDWSTSRGVVRGFIGATAIDQTFVRYAAGWSVNGERVAGLDDVQGLDLGFTPATNLPFLRRANLKVGDAIDRAVAWWEPGASTLQLLPQQYRRRDELSYWYRSPMGPYEAVLEFAPNGFARVYPQLWALESTKTA
jgi:uncharacterized protein